MSLSLTDRDRRVVWHPYTSLLESTPPLAIVRAEGALLYDTEGRSYIDAISSWWTTLHGHRDPRLVAAIVEQASRLDHVIFAGATHEAGVELCERLVALCNERIFESRAIVPGVRRSTFERVFLSDNGSTAVEAAVKLALEVKEQDQGEGSPCRIFAFDGAYHGDTFGAMSVSGRGIFTDPYRDRLFSVVHIPPPTIGHEEEAIASFRAACEDGAPGVFLYEPMILGAGGMKILSGEALGVMLGEAEALGAVLIADEVFTGFGRTGPVFASEAIPVAPHMMTFSKGLTGGVLPLGATVIDRALVEAFSRVDGLGRTKTFFHGHSFTGNPLACSLAVASLCVVSLAQCDEARIRIGDRHREAVSVLKRQPGASGVRALGTILAFEIRASDGGGYLSSVRERIVRIARERGVFLRPLGNTVYTVPPYCTSNEELSVIYALFEELTTHYG